jgi:acyl carrier protein
MSASRPTIDDLKQMIVQSLQLEGVTPDMIGDEDPLFGSGLGLDSVDALELVVAMEQRFKIRIKGEDVGREVFASAASLHRFLHERLERAGGAPA